MPTQQEIAAAVQDVVQAVRARNVSLAQVNGISANLSTASSSLASAQSAVKSTVATLEEMLGV